ncbi:MAG: glucose-6-phosphate isomerase [Proteobacteria bacterium]|nr:glucose-6-phosphate isomerase [Pseudomonadota bacterium]
MKSQTQVVVGPSGRRLLSQDLSGCAADRIGIAGLDDAALSSWIAKAEQPLQRLQVARRDRSLAHLSVPEATADIIAAEAAISELSRDAKTIVFLGTGGSSLGGQALAAVAACGTPVGIPAIRVERPAVAFYDNLDATTLGRALAALDLAHTRFVVISKSGGTPETIAQAVAAMSAIKAAGLGDRMAKHVLAVADPSPPGKPSGLRQLAADFAIPVLDHEPGIGGRFSVLTNVGLLPAIACGLDVRALRRGAKAVVDGLDQKSRAHEFLPAAGAALAIGLAKQCGSRVSVMMPYADGLGRFAEWYVQLWAESLGKGGNGTTPIACLGPLDQHSQLQLFMDGPKEHLVNVVRVPSAGTGPALDPALCERGGIPFLSGRHLGDLVAAQAEAVPEALGKAGRPVRRLDLDRLDEEAFGALLMSMMLETILAGWLIGIDPFDQPAVELAKVLTRDRLTAKT